MLFKLLFIKYSYLNEKKIVDGAEETDFYK